MSQSVPTPALDEGQSLVCLTRQHWIGQVSVACNGASQGNKKESLYPLLSARSIAMVMMVSVEVVSANSVRVSWDSIDIPEITGYTVYYSQTGNRERQSEVTVPSSDNSVVIEGLVNNEEYQFQVAAIAVLDADMITKGQRSTFSSIVVPRPETVMTVMVPSPPRPTTEDSSGISME
jgi:hypothetical protein